MVCRQTQFVIIWTLLFFNANGEFKKNAFPNQTMPTILALHYETERQDSFEVDTVGVSFVWNFLKRNCILSPFKFILGIGGLNLFGALMEYLSIQEEVALLRERIWKARIILDSTCYNVNIFSFVQCKKFNFDAKIAAAFLHLGF